jgi:complement component 1 Q subcomponent-binding protein
MMKRVISTGSKALIAGVSRRGFQTVKSVVPKFSSTRAAAAPVSFRFNSTLTEVLGVELEEENANEDELDQDLLDIKKQVLKVFKIKEEPGLSAVKLTKKHGDELIEIEFNVQDVEDGGDSGIEESEEGDVENDSEGEAEHGIGINFTATIKRGKNSIVISGLAGDALNIENVQYIDAAHADNKDGEVYTGPQFQDLEESVQAAFYEYLTERNIDDDLAFFILAYSRDKEQKEYVNWIAKVREFSSVESK